LSILIKIFLISQSDKHSSREYSAVVKDIIVCWGQGSNFRSLFIHFKSGF